MGLDKFSAALDLLKGFQVNLYVGEEIIKGKLVGVEPDHVVIENDKQYIYYYSIDKIQAITKNTKQFQVEEISSTFQKTQSLTELLQSFKNSWVNILCLNKKRFSGVLSDIDADFATLINGEERILIKLTHISNILKGFIQEEEEKKEKSSKGNEQSKSKSSSNNQDKNEKDTSEQNKDNNSEKKSKETAKENSKEIAQKSETSTKTEIPAAIIEPIENKVWSQPIKPEPAILPLTELISASTTTISSSNTDKVESKEKDVSSKDHSEMKKADTESNKEKKTEEPTATKPKPPAPPKESKPVKEEVIVTKNTVSVKSEEKQVKTSSKEKYVKSSNAKENGVKTSNVKESSAKTSNAKESLTSNVKEMSVIQSSDKDMAVKTVKITSIFQDHQKAENTKEQKQKTYSWNQSDQVEKALRYAGEPVSRDMDKDLTFSGKFNRQRKSFNF